MSKYKEIKGFKVQTLASDTIASQVLGGTWASAASLNTARGNGNSSNQGTSTNTIYFGGYPPAPSRLAITESWNGTAWTEVNDLNQGRSNQGGAGVYTAALCYGGGTQPGQFHPVTTESWNGTSWTEVNDLNSARRELGGAGLQTAAMAIGGNHAPAPKLANVEFWDGTSWTEGADLPTATSNMAASGLTTSALSINGSPTDTKTFKYNGSAWSEDADTNTPRNNLGGSGSGTSALASGGNNVPGTVQTANTEGYDGTSWSELSDLPTGNQALSQSGAAASGNTDAMMMGGQTPSATTATNTWSAPTTFTKINLGQVYYNSGSNAYKVTAQPVAGGTWASGGSLNDARSQVGGVGTQTAAICIGGNTPPETANVETYDGSSWTEVNNLNTGRRLTQGMGTVYTAAIAFGGDSDPTPGGFNNAEVWDGSTWTEVNNLNTTRTELASAGTSTLALGSGGNPPVTGKTEAWDGTSWTEVADLATSRRELNSQSSNSQTSALVFGGSAPPYSSATEEFTAADFTINPVTTS